MRATWIGIVCASTLFAQPPGPPPGGFRPPGGPPGGFPGMQERKLVKKFDRDGDKRLNATERAAAREFLANEPRPQFGPRFGRAGEEHAPVAPGPKLSPKDVRNYGDEPLYDLAVLRTLFLEFENPGWEKELADFKGTDVEVPAKLTVDGKTYPDVGVHFRGSSSFMMVPEGRKRSLNLSLDFVDKKQRLGGYRTLNLLNSNQDPTFLRSVLYLQANRDYIPAPKANYMRVVINGESWGIYVNAQQFNTDFVKEWFPNDKGGRRWKVPGIPFGGGGLVYQGDDPAAYKRQYEIKSKDDETSWKELIRLCKLLKDTPAAELEKTLEPVLDIDGVLRFLAIEKALINNDGYWTRASDFNLYQDDAGRFHVIPHDANETYNPAENFRPPRPRQEMGSQLPASGEGPGQPRGRDWTPRFGPGFPGGPPPEGWPKGGGPPIGSREIMNAKLDPFAGGDDPRKPLLNRLLAVPSLRKRYIAYVREVTTKWLDWSRIEPLAKQYQALIVDDVRKDTRKLGTTDAFTKAVTEETVSQGPGPFGGRPHMSLKDFVEQRKAFLLKHPEIAAK